MRISTIQAFNLGVNGIKDVSDQTVKTQNQLSSGRRILTPADDPVASARVLQLNQDSAQRDQFIANIDGVEGRLELEEVQLGSINEVIIRIRELTVQAGNGAYTMEDRESIAEELDVRLEQLVDLMNSADTNGDYLFSGFSGDTKPFVEIDTGNYVYEGDEGQRFVSVSASSTIATSDSGKSLFVDIDSAKNTFFTKVSPNNVANPPAAITQGVIHDQDAYDAFYPEDMIITFNAPTAVVPTQSNYTITQKSDGRVVSANVPFISGDHINVNGVEVVIEGTPVENDSFFIESSEKQGLLTTVGRLIEGLRTFGDNQNASITNLIETTMSNLDNAQTSILQVQSQVGGRLNTLESTRDLLVQIDITTQEILSELQDLDYAEAVSRLSFETFILEAAQQSYVRVASLSLFNFL